jgi:hypothetical protein
MKLPRVRLTIRQMMVIVPLLGVLCWQLGLAFQRSIEAGEQARCSANLAAIGVALHQYHEKHGHLPSAFVVDASGRPAHSWRVLLLEFLDPGLFREYDMSEPWDGPHNRKLATRMPAVYACPNRHVLAASGHTSYAVIVGTDSAFPGGSAVRFADITDRASNIPTILVVEIDGPEIPWTAPRDLSMRQVVSETSGITPKGLFDLSLTGIASRDPRGAGLLLTDGEVKRVRPTLNMMLLRSMITIAGNEYLSCQHP